MEAPAAQVESEPAQGKLQRCLLCEPWWAERPLEHCCICIMPLRKGALMACGVAFALSLGHTIEFGSLLSHSEDEAPPAFLKFLYFVQLLAMLAVMLGSIVTLASVYTQHAQLRSAPLDGDTDAPVHRGRSGAPPRCSRDSANRFISKN